VQAFFTRLGKIRVIGSGRDLEFRTESPPNARVRTRQIWNDRPSELGRPITSRALSSRLPRVTTMDSTSQQPKGRDSAISTLDAIIQVLSLAKDVCGIPPAQAALASAVILLTMIRVPNPLLRGGEFLIHVV
jgi:hypothetical protein